MAHCPQTSTARRLNQEVEPRENLISTKATRSPTPGRARCNASGCYLSTFHHHRAKKTIRPQAKHISVTESSTFHTNGQILLGSPHLYQTLGLTLTWGRMLIGEAHQAQGQNPPSLKPNAHHDSPYWPNFASSYTRKISARQLLTKPETKQGRSWSPSLSMNA